MGHITQWLVTCSFSLHQWQPSSSVGVLLVRIPLRLALVAVRGVARRHRLSLRVVVDLIASIDGSLSDLRHPVGSEIINDTNVRGCKKKQITSSLQLR
jgi:hypothetical protein